MGAFMTVTSFSFIETGFFKKAGEKIAMIESHSDGRYHCVIDVNHTGNKWFKRKSAAVRYMERRGYVPV